jgi:hypothetical protein
MPTVLIPKPAKLVSCHGCPAFMPYFIVSLTVGRSFGAAVADRRRAVGGRPDKAPLGHRCN